MSEVAEDVKPGSEASADPQPQGQATDGADTSDRGDSEVSERANKRIRDLTKRMKELEENNRAAVEAAVRKRDEQWKQWQSSKAQEQEPKGDDPEEALIRSWLGNDEQGQKAYEMVERLATKKAREALKGSGANEQEIMARVQQLVDRKMNTLKSATSATSQIQDMVKSGIIAEGDVEEVMEAIHTETTANPAWGENPKHMEMLVDSTVARLQRTGTIKPPSRNGKSTVVSPGRGGEATNAQDVEDAQLTEIKSRFRSLRNVDQKRMRELGKRVPAFQQEGA